MKEKKNKGARKVLLVAISAALVAVISVGSTLAYLTARSNTKTNTFTASGNITGEVIEPDAEFDKFDDWAPGEEIAKNPMIDNDTKDYEIWTGAKLSFQIDIGSGYKDVPYSTFVKYVTINGLAGSGWSEYTAGVKADGNKYYYYNTALAADGGDSTEKNYGDSTAKGGTTGAATTDNTTAIFTSVTPNPAITIREKSASETYVTTINANGPQTGDIYQKFLFKITVNGYGVKKESTVTLDDAKDVILSGLGGKA